MKESPPSPTWLLRFQSNPFPTIPNFMGGGLYTGHEVVRYDSDCTASSLDQSWHKILDNQKTTVIQSASAIGNDTTTVIVTDIFNCKLDGSADGIQLK